MREDGIGILIWIDGWTATEHGAERIWDLTAVG